MQNIRFFRRGAGVRRLAVLLIVLLSAYLIFSPAPHLEIAELPYPLYLFTAAEPSTLLLLTLVILLMVLVGRVDRQHTRESRRGRDQPQALSDRSKKAQ